MDQILNMTLRNAIPPALKDNAAFTSKVIDTAIPGGARRLHFVALLGAMDAALTTFKVQQSDAKTDDTTLDGGVDVHDVSVKPGATDDDKLWLITVDLKGEHKRFMQLQATAADGTTGVNLAALALFENPGVPEAKAGAAVHESV